MLSAWPQPKDGWNFPAEEQRIAWAKEAVRAVRTVRVNMNVPAARKAHIFLVSGSEEARASLELSRAFIASLAGGSAVTVQADKAGIGEDAVSAVISVGSVFLPLADLVDFEKEAARLAQEEKRLLGELARCDGMLKNEKFISRAPAAKIEEEQKKREKYASMMEEVRLHLAQLKSRG